MLFKKVMKRSYRIERGGPWRVRTYHKKVIYIKNTGSPFFKEAYFIINEDKIMASANEEDIISEANRIVEEEVRRIKGKPIFEKPKGKIYFAFGFFIALVVAVLWYFTAI